MKITQIECVPLSVPTPMRGPNAAGNILFVKLHTDEGLVGYADAGMVSQDIVVSMIRSWEPILIGANPLDRGPIMAKVSRAIRSQLYSRRTSRYAFATLAADQPGSCSVCAMPQASDAGSSG